MCIHVTDVTDRACACLNSVICFSVDKDHRTSNWVLILYQTCATIEMNWRQELKIVYYLNYELDKLMFEVYQIKTRSERKRRTIKKVA